MAHQLPAHYALNFAQALKQNTCIWRFIGIVIATPTHLHSLTGVSSGCKSEQGGTQQQYCAHGNSTQRYKPAYMHKL
jgi:hypothetical protein